MRNCLTAASLILLLTACGSMRFPGVYRLDIDQGNIITQEMVDQLELGMNRSQVEYIMGTPLVKDSFSPDRWDYVYTLNRDGDPKDHHALTALFENDRLVKIITDIKPSDKGKIGEAEETAAIEEK